MSALVVWEKRPRRASRMSRRWWADGAQRTLRKATYVDCCKNRRWGNRKGR